MKAQKATKMILDKEPAPWGPLQMILDKEPEPPLALQVILDEHKASSLASGPSINDLR